MLTAISPARTHRHTAITFLPRDEVHAMLVIRHPLLAHLPLFLQVSQILVPDIGTPHGISLARALTCQKIGIPLEVNAVNA